MMQKMFAGKQIIFKTKTFILKFAELYGPTGLRKFVSTTLGQIYWN